MQERQFLGHPFTQIFFPDKLYPYGHAVHLAKFAFSHVKQFELETHFSQEFAFRKALLKQDRHFDSSPISQVLQEEAQGIQFPDCRE